MSKVYISDHQHALRDFISNQKGINDIPSRTYLDSYHRKEHASYYLRKMLEVLEGHPQHIASFLEESVYADLLPDATPIPLSSRLTDIASEGMEYWLDNFNEDNASDTIPFNIYELNEATSIRVVKKALENSGRTWLVMPLHSSFSHMKNLPQEWKDKGLIANPHSERVPCTSEYFSDEALRTAASAFVIGTTTTVSSYVLSNPYLSNEKFDSFFEGFKMNDTGTFKAWGDIRYANIPFERVHRALNIGSVRWRSYVPNVLAEFMFDNNLSDEQKRELIDQYWHVGTDFSEEIVRSSLEDNILLNGISQVSDPQLLEKLFWESRDTFSAEAVAPAVLANPYCPRNLVLDYAKMPNFNTVEELVSTSGYVEPNPFQYMNQYKFYSLLSEGEKKEFSRGVSEQLALSGIPVSDAPTRIKAELLSLVVAELTQIVVA